ncbi:peptidoglycan-binding protein [Streptomyces sp. NBC_00647]|uniref:peptidoglycan-binding protein n=1 Tax=Streptomyces sp. NBC_00647 TaxID=2975796 RepID=UPI00324F0B24
MRDIREDVEPGDVVSILGIDHVFYEDAIRTEGSISWNDKNPGNIVRSGEAESYGAYRGKCNNIFAIFPTEAEGFQAIRSFLLKRSSKTILEMMRVYAPSGHGPNDPEVYAQNIATSLGVSTTTTVEELMDGQVTKFAETIQKIEGWRPGQEHYSGSLPDDLSEWLTKFPTRAEREAADQPFARQGSPKAEGIKNIQRCLNDLGWTPALSVDGAFGPKTEAAVKWFQQKKGIISDGIVGNKTWRKLVGL